MRVLRLRKRSCKASARTFCRTCKFIVFTRLHRVRDFNSMRPFYVGFRIWVTGRPVF